MIAPQVMYGHSTSAAVQAHGSLTLWGLAAASPSIRGAVAAAGGIEAVVQAMQQHRAHAQVQEQCAGALQSLAADSLGRARAIGAGGVEAIVAALTCAPDRPPGVSSPPGVAALLLLLHVVPREVFAECCVVPLASRCRREHNTQPAVQEFGCWALANIASGPGCVSERLSKRLSSFARRDPGLHRHVSSVPDAPLPALPRRPLGDLPARLESSGAREAVSLAMANYGQMNPGVAAASERALACIAALSAVAKKP